MKFGRVPDLLLVVLASIHSGDAANFMAPRQVSLADKAGTLAQDKHDKKDMPETAHKKEAGGDYKKGSPLYEKQEARKAAGAPGIKTVKEDKSGDDGLLVKVTAPPLAKAVDGQGGWKAHMYLGLINFVGYFIWVMFTALVWMKCVGPSWSRTRRGVDERKVTSSFSYSLFSVDHCCGHHAPICFFAWFCGPLRLADTYAKEPFPLMGSFWSALVLVTCLLGLSQLSMGLTGTVFLLVAIYFRQQLRRQYGLENGGCTVIMDCLSWCLCPVCSMAQEARQVEFVKKPMDPVKG